jgi:hypothetical protein
MTAATATQPRPLRVIAAEIREDWKRINYGAKPYLKAMAEMDSAKENYYHDPGREIVLYFLSNAQTWRGETARRVKAELKGMI